MTRRVKVYPADRQWKAILPATPDGWFSWECPACQNGHDNQWSWYTNAQTEAAEHWATCPALRLERLIHDLQTQMGRWDWSDTGLECESDMHELLTRHGVKP
jgi:hypothetical protein